MSSFQDIQTTTGLTAEGNVEVHRDVNINIYTTTNYSTAKKEPRIWKPFRTVPAPVPYFSGREDLIAKIHRQIQQCSKQREYSKKIVVIYGLGGIGKSEIARKYVQTHRQDPIILNAAWIDAQSKNSLESSFKSLAEELHLQTKDKEIKDIVSSIYKHLSEYSQPSLFIFDNAEQMRSEDDVFGIFDFLPTFQLDNIPLILITTRFKNWEIPEENILQINELNEEEAVKCLIERWRLSPNQKNDNKIIEALKDLARSLQCFPLGLTLAASNIPHSMLRSISKEIKDYIQKINSTYEGWIPERQSAGTASKYDLIMNNVWEATLEKIQSHGDDGEAAISILNLIAYFPPYEITVENVVKVAEFSGLLTSTAGIEMLELYSLISLPSSRNDKRDIERFDSDDEYHQVIRIHRLVQRCTRDKLDREKNYSSLIKISMFLAHHEDDFVGRQAIHEHLKERMWPKNSFQFSILFACEWNWTACSIIKDVHEVLALDEKPGYLQNLTEDYKILHALNLFRLSIYDSDDFNDDDGYKKLWKDLISKDPSYSRKYLEHVFASSLGKCVKDLFKGAMDIEDLAKRGIFRVLIDTAQYERCWPTLSEEVEEELSLILADGTGNSFEGSVETVGQLYILLWDICCCYKRISCTWYVEAVFKIHGSVYASIIETGDRLDSYWEDDRPIPYALILRELTKNSNAKWNRRFQESFCTKAGLQYLRQHLQYVDGLTQTKTVNLQFNAKSLFEFITFMGWKWNCTKEFVQANLFMETLYRFTKNLFKLNPKYFQVNQFRCLLTWFGLFGKTIYEDRNGVSWSIQSVEKEMILFLDYSNSGGWRLQVYLKFCWNSKTVLNEFIESSGSFQESTAFRTATRMLECLREY